MSNEPSAQIRVTNNENSDLNKKSEDNSVNSAVHEDLVAAEVQSGVQFSEVFELISKLPPTSIIVNSGVILSDGLGFNAPGGGSYILDNRDPNASSVVLLSDRAQIGCASAHQLALIYRETKSASYSLSLVSYNKIEELQQLETLDKWVAKTRGFIPNAGSTCAIIGKREIVVEGTRLRDNKPPYHGIFTLTSQKLSFWSDFGEHVPKIYKAYSVDHIHYVVMESAYDPEGSGVAQRKDAIYKLGAEGVGELVLASQHLNVVSSNAVVTLSNNDVCFGLTSLVSGGVLRADTCLLAGEEVARVRWVSVDTADVYLKSGKHVLAKDLIHAPSFIELPSEIVVLDKKFASEETLSFVEGVRYKASSPDDLYLLATQPDLKRNVVELLGYAKLKSSGSAGVVN